MTQKRYYPSGILGEGRARSLLLSMYEEPLEAMDEEPLYPVNRERPTTYRILWLPSFSHPSVVRVFKSKEGWTIVGKATDGEDDSSPGKLAWNLERTLHLSESRQLEQLIQRLQFWAMSVRDDHFGFDGETWLIEGVQDDKYHFVQRWSPREECLLDFGEFLQTTSRVTQYRPDPEIAEQRFRAEAEANAERERKCSEAIVRSNTMARSLAAKLTTDGLTCPHCQKRTREHRFIDKSPDSKSYFICTCGGSFGPEQYEVAGGA